MTAPLAVPTSAPLDEQVTFIQHALPGFETGRYTLTVEQRLADSVGTEITEQNRAYEFAVLGDRFRFANPVSTVFAVFPEDGATGEFSTVLPHVVISAETLPWARSLLPVETPEPGTDTDKPVPTWLAVLVLDGTEDGIGAVDATIGSLLNVTEDRPGTHSYFSDRENPTLEPGEDAATAIRVIDLPLTTFWRVAPSAEDLNWLAHVRRVSLLNKATIPRISDQGEAVGEFAVVVANRLPAKGVTSTAYLVSLDGLQRLLPNGDGGKPDQVPADATTVRLAVLKSWRFTATDDKTTFADALCGLNSSPTGPAATTVSLPFDSSDADVAAALRGGYVPLDHDLRDAGHTVSWYRGPLAPVAVEADRVDLPVSSADQAALLDPTTGLLDVSYAAAWTLGRMLALQDTAFSTGLYRWKVGLSRQVVDRAEAEVLLRGVGLSPTARTAPSEPSDVSESLSRVVPQLLANLSQRRPCRLGDEGWRRIVMTIARSDVRKHVAGALDGTSDSARHHREHRLKPELRAWLARLIALNGVPFPYLVPDERMLPPESIRFFSIDANWISALVDGAFSIGRNLSTAEDTFSGGVDRLVAPSVQQQALQGVGQLRADALGIEPTAEGLPVMSGFLLRSWIVPAYPGLGVSAHGAPTAQDLHPVLPLLRFERLGQTSDTLICIVEGDAVGFDVHEAPEHLHYGIDDYSDTDGVTAHKTTATFSGQDPVVVDPGQRPRFDISDCFRPGSDRTLRLGALAAKVGARDSAQLGYVMTEGVGLVSFLRAST